MFKKFFTNQQISIFFQTAVLLDTTSMLLDLFIYHFCPNNLQLKLLTENINNLALFMICITIISQFARFFENNHEAFVHQYRILAGMIEISISIFFFWIFSMESDMANDFIIFFSRASIYDYSFKIICILIIIFILLITDFYQSIKNPVEINNSSIQELIKSTIKLVVRRHLLILIFIFGFIHFKKLHKISVILLQNSISSFFSNLTLLEILIPMYWLAALIYYFYYRIQEHKTMYKK